MAARIAGLPARPATWDDIHDVLDLLVACDVADVGEPDISLEDLEVDWTNDEFALAVDSLLVHDGDQLVGYGYVTTRDGGRELETEAYVHPDRRQGAIDDGLFVWAEERARERAAALPTGTTEALTTFNVEGSSQIAILERRGWVERRRFFRMVRDLTGDIEPGTVDPALTVRTFRPDDARAVYEAYEEAFTDNWNHAHESYAQWRARTIEHGNFSPDLWFLAFDGDDLAGFVLGRDDRVETAWIPHVGVRRPWRGRGVARGLLLEAFGAFKARGFERVALGVDATSLTGATRLYERAGMKPEIVFLFHALALDR